MTPNNRWKRKSLVDSDSLVVLDVVVVLPRSFDDSFVDSSAERSFVRGRSDFVQSVTATAASPWIG